MNDTMMNEPGAPKIADRRTFQAELDALRMREKAHPREGDAIGGPLYTSQRRGLEIV